MNSSQSRNKAYTHTFDAQSGSTLGEEESVEIIIMSMKLYWDVCLLYSAPRHYNSRPEGTAAYARTTPTGPHP